MHLVAPVVHSELQSCPFESTVVTLKGVLIAVINGVSLNFSLDYTKLVTLSAGTTFLLMLFKLVVVENLCASKRLEPAL
jgi:hypothetical protein